MSSNEKQPSRAETLDILIKSLEEMKAKGGNLEDLDLVIFAKAPIVPEKDLGQEPMFMKLRNVIGTPDGLVRMIGDFYMDHAETFALIKSGINFGEYGVILDNKRAVEEYHRQMEQQGLGGVDDLLSGMRSSDTEIN